MKIDELNQFLKILGLENLLLYSIRDGNKVDLVNMSNHSEFWHDVSE